MKRTPLKRKTKLKAKTPLKRSKLTAKPSKPRKSALPTTTKKRRVKTDLQRTKEKLWEECKRITRERHGLKCYTCGSEPDHPHTGHFISSSVCSVELRYDLENLRPQCYRCNINLSGNWIEYERRLKSDGIDVEALKRRNEETKGKQYDIIWYQNKLEEYKQL